MRPVSYLVFFPSVNFISESETVSSLFSTSVICHCTPDILVSSSDTSSVRSLSLFIASSIHLAFSEGSMSRCVWAFSSSRLSPTSMHGSDSFSCLSPCPSVSGLDFSFSFLPEALPSFRWFLLPIIRILSLVHCPSGLFLWSQAAGFLSVLPPLLLLLFSCSSWLFQDRSRP